MKKKVSLLSMDLLPQPLRSAPLTEQDLSKETIKTASYIKFLTQKEKV